jgi:hypothetical protein
MPLELKPSICGAVMHGTKDGTKMVFDMNDGVDWRKEPLGGFIARLSHQMPVFVRIRARLIYIHNNVVLSDFVDARLMTDSRIDVELPE